MRAIMEKIKRRGENYTIPQIDLSVEPKNTKEEFKYLYEDVYKRQYPRSHPVT